MIGPILDQRTKQNLMELIARRAKEYAPEWRYEPGSDDPGAAIAELFGELFYQTLDRFNEIPNKYYTEFLNLLGVASPTVTPASGLVQFGVGGASNLPVPVPRGTEVFAPVEGGENIVFETERRIEVTSASLQEIYYVDAKGGHIERLSSLSDQPFFAPAGGENLQKHRFAFSQNEVLALGGPCTVEVSLHQNARFLEQSTAARLGDPAFAAWSYWNGQEYKRFDRVGARDGTLRLEKDTQDRLEPDANGRICIYCDLVGEAEGDILLSGISIRSSTPKSARANALSNNDIPILQGEGGYCFGRRPAAYALFYIRADDVFVKRGAHVNVQLGVTAIVHSDVNHEPQYAFNKHIIDKSDAVRVVPEDVFVQHVVWEYFNGTGWAVLPASGNINPFSGKEEGDLVLLFTVPVDMAPTLVNAEQGYYIRARVVNVENYLSIIPKWILPFVKEVKCAYQYANRMPVDYIVAMNNGETVEIENAAGIDDWALAVFRPMAPNPRAMYLCFDASPHAMPLSMLFELWGETVLLSKILFEAWVNGKFEQVRAIDHTQNLRYTGLIFLYVPEPLEETVLFNQRGYWLRMSLSSYRAYNTRAPHVNGIALNTVNAVQRQKATTQFFSTGIYEAGKSLELMEKPVLRCEVWVDEALAISAQELASFEKEHADTIRVEREGSQVIHCWVKWEAVPSIVRASRDARVYELDYYTGVIMFGKGANGKVPPQGDLNIRVEYSYGGGVKGNMPLGRVSALVGSIPRINSVKNITPMSGGTDRPPVQKMEALGNKRLRHRHTALSAADFEQMTLEQFERAAHVKCFPGVNENGMPMPGHVCLVVMGRALDGERMTAELCRKIYEYLAPRCDCNLVHDGRLHVVPSMELSVNVEVRVQMLDLDQAAITQQQISDNISALIENVWRTRDIGAQIDINEIYQAVKSAPNVESITRILPEGSYEREGRRHLVALDSGEEFPFATVKNGTHTVRIG